LNLPLPGHECWTSLEISREPGSRLLLHTDGFADAASAEGDLFSESPDYQQIILRALAHPPARARSILEEALLSHTHRLPQEDDRAFLVAEMS
jgi:serine phosphatase RsbU (regulator of sigma subunit)